MLTVEIRVNGSLITAVDMQNVGVWDTDTSAYRWRLVRFPIDMASDPESARGTIKHKRKDGAEKLVAAVLKQAMR